MIVEEITNVADQQHLDSLVIKKDKHCLNFRSNYYQVSIIEPSSYIPPTNRMKDAAIEGFARTTNAVEGWHYGI